MEWGYLFSALERFGFGPRFISWVKLLYTAPRASVCTNNNVHLLQTQTGHKMNVLHTFAYVFQCFPLFLTKSFFSKLNNHISAFIWSKKPPRIKRQILQRPRAKGGMALPNFMYYYWAANIRLLLYWMGESAAAPEWTIMEGASIVSTSPAALLYAKLPFTQPLSSFTSNPIVVH